MLSEEFSSKNSSKTSQQCGLLPLITFVTFNQLLSIFLLSVLRFVVAPGLPCFLDCHG
jgi:hypothetical protein